MVSTTDDVGFEVRRYIPCSNAYLKEPTTILCDFCSSCFAIVGHVLSMVCPDLSLYLFVFTVDLLPNISYNALHSFVTLSFAHDSRVVACI